MNLLHTPAGVPVYTSPLVKSKRAYLFAVDPATPPGQGAPVGMALFVHRDELHMIHAACGNFTDAFRTLDETIRRNIDRAASAALARIEAPR